MREKCRLVGVPEHDPVHGPEGPMTALEMKLFILNAK